MIGQLIRHTCIMLGIPKKSNELRYAIFKISFSTKRATPFENLAGKIYNDENLLFALKYGIKTTRGVGVKWFVKYGKINIKKYD